MRIRRLCITLFSIFLVSCALAAPVCAEEGWQLRLIDDTGFGDPYNTGITRMSAYGNYLYLGTWNSAEGCEVYRSADGESWELINTAGFGNANNFCVLYIEWFNGSLYVTTWNQANGFSMYRANADAANRADISWQAITTNGFGDTRNYGGTSARVFNGYLYVGCFNPTSGPEVWRSATGGPGMWTQVNQDSWGFPSGTDATMMLMHDGYLYVGTEAARWPYAGCQLWRTDGNLFPPYNQWQKVNANGFGDRANHNICGLAVFNGKMYAGTWNVSQGLEVWRATPTETVPFSDWEQVAPNGFGDPTMALTCDIDVLGDTLFVGAGRSYGPDGGVLMKTTDGTTWEQVYVPGFVNPPSAGICWLETFRGKLFVGGWSGVGTPPLQLWVYEPVGGEPVPAMGLVASIGCAVGCLAISIRALLNRITVGSPFARVPLVYLRVMRA